MKNWKKLSEKYIYMDTKNVLLVLGLVILLFIIMHNTRYIIKTSTPTTTSTTVIHKKTPNPIIVTPHYNSYKAQYYN